MHHLPFVGVRISGVILALLAGACSAGGGGGPSGQPGSGATATGAGAQGGGLNGLGGTGPMLGLGGSGVQAAPNCGNGELTDDEACDDGNKASGDGCKETCLEVERGFSCASPGKACREIARCGDGVVAASERCDDGNVTPGDGCSERCKVELGKKCDGAPSVCTDAECGNSVVEGAESCDDGNNVPFDGCSSLCLREPNCQGQSCTSECGDGIVINEDCDDGNTLDGDGCSATCTKENGFTCKQEPQCEKLNGQCVLRVPAIFRDFGESHPDFGGGAACGIAEGDPLVEGIASAMLDAEGRPVLGTAPAKACIESAQSFATWFRDGDGVARVVSSVALFDNGSGGYVNRFGQNGEKLVVYVAPAVGMGNEQSVQGATSQATCRPGCTTRTRSSLQCDNQCRPDHDALDDRTRQLAQREQELLQRQEQLALAQAQPTPDAAAIATLEAQIAAVEALIVDLEELIVTLTAAATACDTQCQTQFDGLVDACVADCKPCSSNPAEFCTGGQAREFDGTPVFFPVDSVMGPTRDEGLARLPKQYGYNGWPNESSFFPGAPKHNFYFTSEVQYWFRYEADTNARLDFTGDDDVWVYINGHLAVDLGGIHVPMDGSVTINAASAARFGLTAGNVYKIAVFQAERKKEGSSFRLTLSGFEAAPSDCTAVCGDAILSFGEECDDGMNDGGYGECDASCKLGAYCGDGVVQAGNEQCDEGPGSTAACAGCRRLKPPA